MTLQVPFRDRGTSSRLDRKRRRTGATPESVFWSCELFAGLNAAQYRQVGRLFTVVDVRAGTVLGLQGQVCREFIVILDGEVAVLRDGAPVAVLPRASHFGAAPLMHRDRPFRLVSLHALGPARLAVATPREFESLRESVPQVGHRITALADRRQAYFDGMDAALHTLVVTEQFPVIETPV